MKRILLALLLLLPVSASAQFNGCSAGFCAPLSSVVASYTGPCDISGVTCIAYYAVSGCAQAAYSGNVVDVVDAATGTTTGTRLQCSAGVVSALVSASACTFVTGNACSPLATTCAVSCTFSTIYNQLGTGSLPNLTVPSTLADRATITLSALNSKPCLFSNSASVPSAAPSSTTSVASPFTLIAVAERNAGFTTNGRIISTGTGTVNIGYRSTANTVGSEGGTITATASDSVFHGLMLVHNSASSFIVVDGSPSTTGTLAAAWSATQGPILMSDNATGSGAAMQGYLCESIVTSNALGSTAYIALNTNFRNTNRWGNSF